MTAAHVEEPREQGHAIVRGFLPADEIAQAKRAGDEVMAEGLGHHANYRDRTEVFRNLAGSYFNTGLAIDPHGPKNGGLATFPRNHARGYLGLADDGPVMIGRTANDELIAAGLDPAARHERELAPGNLVIWTLLTVHRSLPNRSGRDRCIKISSYVRADDSQGRGEWVFRDRQPVPLGPEPEICRYEHLHERPGSFYIDEDWTGEAATQLSRSKTSASLQR